MRNLIRHLAARSAPFVIMSALVLAAFELLICRIVSLVDIQGMIRAISQALPPVVRMAIAEQFIGETRHDLLAFGWNHPLVHALGAAVAIVLGARAIAGEIDGGAIELVLSEPISRPAYYAAHMLHGLAALALLTGSGMLGWSIGRAAFDLPDFALLTSMTLAVNFWLLLVGWFALTLALSSFGRENGPVATIGFFIAIVSLLLRVVGVIWKPLELVLPLSLYHYYDPREILVHHARDLGDLAVLAIVATTAFIAGAVTFFRRDLP